MISFCHTEVLAKCFIFLIICSYNFFLIPNVAHILCMTFPPWSDLLKVCTFFFFQTKSVVFCFLLLSFTFLFLLPFCIEWSTFHLFCFPNTFILGLSFLSLLLAASNWFLICCIFIDIYFLIVGNFSFVFFNSRVIYIDLVKFLNISVCHPFVG